MSNVPHSYHRYIRRLSICTKSAADRLSGTAPVPREPVSEQLRQLLTHPIRGLDNYAELFERLQNPDGAIKIFCEVAAS